MKKQFPFIRKTVVTLSLLVISVFNGKAQFVSIPDANFVLYLQANFAAAMNGNQMDTSNTDVINATSVDCGGLNIADITGIQYFDNLTTLNCSLNSLSSLPILPSILTSLNCSNNTISCLPFLPPTLQTITATGNSITCLPNLPNGTLVSDIGTDVCYSILPGLSQPALDFCVCNGEVIVTTVGGPYDYVWSNGYNDLGNSQELSILMNACSGIQYSATITPTGGGCTAYFAGGSPGGPDSILISVNTVNTSCSGFADGSACLSVAGGVPPYSYQWSTSVTTSCVTNLASGVYSVVVTDANGCTGTSAFVINDPQSLIITGAPDQSVCAGTTVQLCANAFGGTPPYNYLWSTNSTGSCIPGGVSFSGVYMVTVTDVNGCSAMDATTITVLPLPFAGLDSIQHVDCFAANTGGIFISASGSAPFTYLWSPGGATTEDLTNISAGTYTVTVTDVTGCSTQNSFTLGCDSVWPGDANYDGIANNNDLLSIGIGFGNTGTVRVGASNSWTAQAAADWAGSLASGTNYKHVDCNGDGVINSDDTTAIVLNYGLAHPFRLMPATAGLNDPPLYFDLPVDTVGTNQLLQVPLLFGTSAIPADNIYGLAFTVNYDTSLVKADSVRIDFDNSWLGALGTDLIFIQHNNAADGKLNVGVTRTDHNNISGFGEIARVTVVTIDNVSGRIMTPGIIDTLTFSLSDVTVINNQEDVVAVNVSDGSLIIQDTTLSVSDLFSPGKIKIYPNPVNEKMFIEIPPGLPVDGISVTNVIGEKMSMAYIVKNNVVEIKHLKNYDNGIYFLNLESAKGRIVKRFSIIH